MKDAVNVPRKYYFLLVKMLKHIPVASASTRVSSFLMYNANIFDKFLYSSKDIVNFFLGTSCVSTDPI